MKEQAEELHRESLELLAKLASSTLPCEEFSMVKGSKSKNNNCKICQQNNCGGRCDKENTPQSTIKSTEEMTPKKDLNKSLNEPLTPTANLKMLVCAASVLTPAANLIQEEKRQLFVNDKIPPKPEGKENCIKTERFQENKQVKKGQLLGRKEKSLGLLCKRCFLNNIVCWYYITIFCVF